MSLFGSPEADDLSNRALPAYLVARPRQHPAMALSIKTAEADELARVMGETLTEAMTVALRERLAREHARRGSADLATRLATLSAQLRAVYDTSPVTHAEWDAASGDDEWSRQAQP